MADLEGFSLLFDRLGEPMISPKGDKNAVFKLTEQHLGDEYKNIGTNLNNRFLGSSKDVINLEEMNRVPQFNKAKRLPHDAEFSLFIPSHQDMADEVIKELLAIPVNQLKQLLSTCVYTRVNLNPQLFNYCYSVALMHRPDTQGISIQNLAETFPSKFMNSQTFSQARETALVSARGLPRIPIIIPRDYTASDGDIEHRIAYFREDIGVNLHHWHWHLIYPFKAEPESIVKKDRRGELFYYMHQQLIARYNGERLNNSLARVKKFNNWNEPIKEAYFPKMDSLTASRGWPPRMANMRWQELDRRVDELKVTMADMNSARRNIEEAIATGLVIHRDGSMKKLDIDTLGNMVEASILSPNPDLYGDLHNGGHVLTACIHDPKHNYLENMSVMGDVATAMRDPFFYTWHAFIDDIFQQFKESNSVSPYLRSELDNPNVQITSVRVESGTGEVNTLNTFWMQSDVDLSRGLDFSERGPVYARFTHLNHRPFRYVIDVNNKSYAKRTTVRIFMAPKYDERKLPWILSDQRKLFIEMDRFVILLKAGRNTIKRLSSDSSVTIPFDQTFRDLSAQGKDPRAPQLAGFNYCGCGWPQHMLVPKGTETGAKYDLFVMLSNYELDSVHNPDGSTLSCVEASSFCGLKDRLYPDRRSMGYPFDRPSSSASNIQDFLLPNMALVDLTIRLQDVTEPNPRNPQN